MSASGRCCLCPRTFTGLNLRSVETQMQVHYRREHLDKPLPQREVTDGTAMDSTGHLDA